MTSPYSLRKISEEDISFLFELYHCPEITKYMSHPFQTIKDARDYYDFISGVNEEGSEPGMVYVIQTSNKEAIGIVGLDYILGPTAYLTFALKPEYWHKGIMQTVLNDFLSKHTKLYKNIIVRVREDNTPALKLLSKLSSSLQIELLKSSHY